MGRLINVVAFFSKPEKEGTPLLDGEVRGATVSDVLAEFDGWEDEVLQLLEVCPSIWHSGLVIKLQNFRISA